MITKKEASKYPKSLWRGLKQICLGHVLKNDAVSGIREIRTITSGRRVSGGQGDGPDRWPQNKTGGAQVQGVSMWIYNKVHPEGFPFWS